MSLQLNLQYLDVLQLIRQMSIEELQQLKKDVNIAIKINQKNRLLLQYLIGYFKGVEKVINTNQFNALLYLIDFGHYALHEKSITEFTYQKNESNSFPVPLELEEVLVPLYNKVVFKSRDSNGTDSILSVEKSPSFGSLYLTKEERETINKTLNYFQDKDDFEKEARYHYSWVSTKLNEGISYEKARFCDFRWLGYFYDKTQEEFDEINRSREEWSEDKDIGDLLKQIQKL